MTLVLVRLAFAGLRSRLLSGVLTVLLAASAAGTIVLALEVRDTGRDPWQRTFEAAHGAHVLADLPTATAAESLREIDSVAESSEPVPHTLLELQTAGGDEPLQVSGLSARPTVDTPIATAGSAGPDDGIVLERSLARALGLDVGAPLTVSGPGGDAEVEVVGTAILSSVSRYPRANPGIAWLDRATFEQLQPDQARWRWTEALRLDDPGAARTVADTVLAGAPPGTASVQTWQDQRDDALKDAQPFQLILSMYSLVLLAVVVVVVAILVGARVLEQDREIGLLKAVGLTPRQVTSVFVIESSVLGVVAAVLGFAAGALCAPYVAGAMAETMVGSPAVAADPVHLVVTAALVVLVLAASAWFAARRRTRASVLQAIQSGRGLPPRRSWLVLGARALPRSVSLAVGARALARGRALLVTAAVSLTGASVVFALMMQATLDDRPEGPSDVPAELPALVYTLDAVLLVISMTSLVAVALLSLRERLRDFGILKTIGLTPRQVAATLVSPFVVLAVVAGVVSVPLGIGLFDLAFAVSGGDGHPEPAPLAWLVSVPVGTVLLVFLATSLPSRLATRSPVTRALQAE
jgi:putative ABC transport system permease protein